MEKQICSKLKSGGGGVIVWGFLQLTQEIYTIESNMDKNVYLDILYQNLKASAEKLNIKDEFVFYQDNDPKHTSYITKEWCLYSHPKVLKTSVTTLE